MKAVSGWLIIAMLLMLAIPAAAQQHAVGIDPEALIEQIVNIEKKQREQIKDVTFDTELLIGENDNKMIFQEKSRFFKKVYLKFLDDTTWFHEEYLEYYEKDELQSAEKRDEKAAERIEKRRKRKGNFISRPMLLPFYPESREYYDIIYEGVTEDKIDDHVCHQFSVHSKVEEESYINGDFFFEAETFHLVRVDFTLVNLKSLDISISYSPSPDGFWLLRQIEIKGKRKTAFLFSENFATFEYFRNPQINTNLPDKLFEADNEK